MSASVGHELREARQAKNLTIEQISRVTHIRPRHLEALEAGSLDTLPSLAQARGFLRAYAVHLGLAADALVERLGQENGGKQPAPAATATPADAFAGDLYVQIGDLLRNRRETLGISLTEVESQTRVRRQFLEALEAGDFASLPSPVQGRGMLKNFAAFLGLDPDPLLLKFADGLQAQLAQRRAKGAGPVSRGRRFTLSRFISGDLLVGSLLILGFIFFVIWAVGRVTTLQAAQEVSATAPAIVDILDPSTTPTASPPTSTATLTPDGQSPAAGQATLAPETPLPITGDAPVQVYIIVLQRTWMRVTVDGAVEFEGRVIPGSAYPFSGRTEIIVLTGSGSALEVTYNQTNLGPLGLFGQIVERIYTATGVLIPTPAQSPTPTVTQTPLAEEMTPTPTP